VSGGVEEYSLLKERPVSIEQSSVLVLTNHVPVNFKSDRNPGHWKKNAKNTLGNKSEREEIAFHTTLKFEFTTKSPLRSGWINLVKAQFASRVEHLQSWAQNGLVASGPGAH
jgi:hypothetical protein